MADKKGRNKLLSGAGGGLELLLVSLNHKSSQILLPSHKIRPVRKYTYLKTIPLYKRKTIARLLVKRHKKRKGLELVIINGSKVLICFYLVQKKAIFLVSCCSPLCMHMAGVLGTSPLVSLLANNQHGIKYIHISIYTIYIYINIYHKWIYIWYISMYLCIVCHTMLVCL